MTDVVSKIVHIRKQERGILIATVLGSGLSALAWLPWQGVSIWVGVTLFGVALGKVLLDHLARRGGNDHMLAAATFLAGLWYALLPMALVLRGRELAILTGVCMVGSVTLRAANEFTISKSVGLASIAAVFLVASVGVFLQPVPATTPELLALLSANTLLFAYILLHAKQRRDAETGMSTALLEAERNHRKAQAASDAKSAFLANMSHEIRTPLNGIMGMTQAMAASTRSAEQKRRLAVIQESGRVLQVLLDDVLDLARIEVGKMEIACLEFSPAEVARSVFDSFEDLARAKGLGFEIYIAPSAAGRYRGDPIRLRQVLTNLASNAVKFTDKGKVALSVAQEGPRLRFDVADTGKGLPKGQAHLLFKAFSQLDDSPTRRHGGSGLGLSISRSLCELMGGDILVQSEPGRGATFTVLLPLEQVTSPAGTGSAAPALHSRTSAMQLPQIKLLAAEDNQINQLVLQTLLEQVGITAVMVENGSLAVDAWRTQDWDIILMDVQMPDMDGVTATRMIRQAEQDLGRRRTPIIALTANAMSHQIVEYQLAQMDACIAKPISASELYAAIEGFMVSEQDSVTGINQQLASGNA